MPKIRKIIILIVISLLFGMTTFLIYKNSIGEPYTEIERNDNNQEKESSVIEEKNDNQNIEINNSEKVQENNVIEEQNTNTQNINQSNEKTEESTIKQETDNSLSTNNEKESSSSRSSSESYNTNENSNVNNNSTTTKIEPWEQLGLTENQYYNEPIWSWARVDYHIDNYSNREETKNACEQESMRLMNEENIASGCTEINSYSGRYLGEMLTKES